MTFLIFASMVALVIVGFEILRELKQERGRYVTLLVSGDVTDAQADLVAERIAAAVANTVDTGTIRNLVPPSHRHGYQPTKPGPQVPPRPPEGWSPPKGARSPMRPFPGDEPRSAFPFMFDREDDK